MHDGRVMVDATVVDETAIKKVRAGVLIALRVGRRFVSLVDGAEMRKGKAMDEFRKAFMKAFTEGLDEANEREMNQTHYGTLTDANRADPERITRAPGMSPEPQADLLIDGALMGLRQAEHDETYNAFLDAFRVGHSHASVYGMLAPSVGPPKDFLAERIEAGGGRVGLPGQGVLATGAKAPVAGREPVQSGPQREPKDNGQAEGWTPEQQPRRANVRAVGEAPYVLSKAAREMLTSNNPPPGVKGDALRKRASALPEPYRGSLIYERMLLAS